MIDFDKWWNSAAADAFRAKHEDMDGAEVQPVWDAAMAAAAPPPAVGVSDAQIESYIATVLGSRDFPDMTPGTTSYWLTADELRAMIDSLSPASKPEAPVGWKLVPVDITPKMAKAMQEAWSMACTASASTPYAHRLYAAALAAAPAEAPANEDGDAEFLTSVWELLPTWSGEDWNELLERNPQIVSLLRPLVTAQCTKPPAGWECSRTPGHDGPCAALAAPAQGDAKMLADAEIAALRDKHGITSSGRGIRGFEQIRDFVSDALRAARQSKGDAA